MSLAARLQISGSLWLGYSTISKASWKSLGIEFFPWFPLAFEDITVVMTLILGETVDRKTMIRAMCRNFLVFLSVSKVNELSNSVLSTGILTKTEQLGGGLKRKSIVLFKRYYLNWFKRKVLYTSSMSGLQSQRFVSTFALSHCAARLTCHLRVWVAMLVLGYWANIVNNTRSHLFPHCSQKKAVTYYYSLSSSNAFFLYLDGIPASRLRSLQNGGFLPCIIFITGRSSVIWSWNDSINEDTSLPMLGNLLITFQSGYLWQGFV